MPYNFLKIVFYIIILFSIWFCSIYYQDYKKTNQFIKDLKKSITYHDHQIDKIYNDFLVNTNVDLSSQNVSISLVNFPYVFDWQTIAYYEDSDINSLNDLIGFAAGKDNDDKVEIYLSYKDWKSLSSYEKKKLLYHELLHDVFNLEHESDDCSIMHEKINLCNHYNLDYQLSQLINQLQF